MKESETTRDAATFEGGERLEALCNEFTREWSQGRQPAIEAYLERVAEPARHLLLRELIAAELHLRQSAGQVVKLWEYYQRFPAHARSVDAAMRIVARRVASQSQPISPMDDTVVRETGESQNDALTSLVSDGTYGLDSETRRIAHFHLLEHLGDGRFGSVWKARDTKLDRTVAVKLPRQSGSSQRQIDLFFREARAAAQVRHPHIVSIHEVGRDGDAIYMATEFIQGVNLRQDLASHGLRSPRKAAAFCVKVAEALHCAHEAGVVHRDLKPSNIMVDVNGEPHVADFGLAKRQAVDLTMTVEGQVIGTPAYMSPEQADGQAHSADRRTDVYSLGVILFELLTGELPFRGDRQMLIMQKLRDQPPSPRQLNSGVPRDLETVCLKCLERTPQKRYSTCAAVADDLRRFLADRPIQARPIGALERVWRWFTRSPQATLLAAGGYSTFLATALLFWCAAGALQTVVAQGNSLSMEAALEWAGLIGLLLCPMLACGLRTLAGSRRALALSTVLMTVFLAASLFLCFSAPRAFEGIVLLPLAFSSPDLQGPLFSLLVWLALLGLVVHMVGLAHSRSQQPQ